MKRAKLCSAKQAQVLGGLEVGERVIAAPAEGLRDGMRVRMK